MSDNNSNANNDPADEPADEPLDADINDIEANHESIAQTRPKGDFLPWALAGVLALICVALVSGIALWVYRIKPEIESEQRKQLDQLAVQVEELESEKSELEGEIESLGETKNELDAENSNLESTKEKLQDEIEDLIGFKKNADGFKNSDVILFGEIDVAVGFKQIGDDALKVVAKSKGFGSRICNDVAFRSGIARIEGNVLANEIYNQVAVGNQLKELHCEKVFRRYRVHRFVPFAPDESPKMVSFIDIADQKTKIGFYSNHTRKELTYRGFSNELITVKKASIVPGTARFGSPDEVFEEIDELDFMDFAALQVAKNVGSPGNRRTGVKIGIKPSIDIPDSMLTSKSNINAQITLWDTITLNLLKDLGHKSDQEKQYEMISKEMEDEFYAKLVKLGLPVVEREKMDRVINGYKEITLEAKKELSTTLGVDSAFPVSVGASGSASTSIPLMGNAALTSHVAMFEVAPTKKSNMFRISFRLCNSETGEVIWADTAERPIWKPIAAKYQFVKSGKLHIINDPYKIRKLRKADIPGNKSPTAYYKPRLVYYEEQFEEKTQSPYRDMTGITFVDIPKKRIHKPSSYPVEKPEDFPPLISTDYIAWDIVENVAPSAGRITSVDRYRECQIQINNAARFLKPGDTLQVNRFESEDKVETVPVILTVVQVNGDNVVASPNISKLEPVWESTNEPARGDIVFCRNMRRPLVAIENAKIIEPKFRIPTNKRKRLLYELTKKVSERVSSVVRSKCELANVDIIEGQSLESVVDGGATHIAKVTIEATNFHVFRVGVRIFKAGSEEPIRQFEVSLWEKEL